MKKFEGIEQIGFTVNKAHNVAFGTVGEYKFIINFFTTTKTIFYNCNNEK